ncbi:MAG: globin domain-containing protein [Pseudomonadota bacterium]
MKELEIALVRESWAQVIPIAEEAIALFYKNLFELDGRIAQLFEGKDLSLQGARLVDVLDLVIREIDQHHTLAERLQEIGARHADYGASEYDFVTVGKALIMTLKNGLPGIWTSAHEHSWKAAYTIVAAEMLAGHRARRPA